MKTCGFPQFLLFFYSIFVSTLGVPLHTSRSSAKNFCSKFSRHGIYVISLPPKFAVSVCKFHIAPLLKNQKCAFSFQIHHKSRNTHFGGNKITCPVYVFHADANGFDLFKTDEKKAKFDYIDSLSAKFHNSIFKKFIFRIDNFFIFVYNILAYITDGKAD